MNFLKEIENIKNQIIEYYTMSFNNNDDDYQYNKKIKEQLISIIAVDEQENEIKNKALLVLAESTGCAEDQKIAEDIISYLYSNGYIDDTQLHYFYDNIATNRWN